MTPEEEEAIRFQSRLLEQFQQKSQASKQKQLHHPQLPLQLQQQDDNQEEEASVIAALKLSAADSSSQTASTAPDDDYTVATMSDVSWKSLREQQQRQFERLRQQQQQQEAFARSKCASSGSWGSPEEEEDAHSTIHSSHWDASSGSATQTRCNNTGERRRASELSTSASVSVSDLLVEHSFSADPAATLSATAVAATTSHLRYQEEIGHSYSDNAFTPSRNRPSRMSQSVSSLQDSSSFLLDTATANSTTSCSARRRGRVSSCSSISNNNGNGNRMLPRKVCSASSTRRSSSASNPNANANAASYTRQQSHDEWTRKREALAPNTNTKVETLTRTASLNNNTQYEQQQLRQQQDWNDQEAKRQMQFPGISQAIAERVANRAVASATGTATASHPVTSTTTISGRRRASSISTPTPISTSPTLTPTSHTHNNNLDDGMDDNRDNDNTPTTSTTNRSSQRRTTPTDDTPNNHNHSNNTTTTTTTTSDELPVMPNIMVERVTPSPRMLRKTSSRTSDNINNNNNNTNNNNDSSNEENSAFYSDYIVEDHEYVGAFYVSNVDALGNDIVPRPPSSHGGRPVHSIQHPNSRGAFSDTQSTITTNTRQTMFSDEQTNQYHHQGNSSSFRTNNNDRNNTTSYSTNEENLSIIREPDLPPIPAELVTADPVAPTYRINFVPADDSRQEQSQRDAKKKQQYKKKQLIYSFAAGVCCMLVLLGAILVALTFTMDIFDLSDPDDEAIASAESIIDSNNNNGNVNTAKPTESPTMAPTAIVLPLPNYTLEAIENQLSPQANAYQWILQDMQMNPSFPTERHLQRYALATIFFSTNKDNTWRHTTGWLDYSVAECDWATAKDKGVLDPYRICDPMTGDFEALELSFNGLKGTLPPELSLLTRLKYLDLERNQLGEGRGGIPTELGSLTELQELHLFSSRISGSIPTELGSLKNLKTLDLEQNYLSSVIPSELGKLSYLKAFVLYSNRLGGTLPTELSSFFRNRLMTFNVGLNSLTGTIPTEYSEALALRKTVTGQIIGESATENFRAKFDRNDLTGTVPNEFCSLKQPLLTFDCGADELCGCSWCACVAN